MSFFRRVVDERFLAHRRRSTSLAGMAGALVAAGLLAWRWYAEGRFNVDLFVVLAAMALVKVAVLTWSSFTD